MIHELADVQTLTIGEHTKVWQFSIILGGAKIGKFCNINCHTFIENEVVIGDNVTIKPGVYIWDGMVLEDNVMIGPNVTFTNDKFPRSKNTNYKLEKTVIRRGASVGAGAIILCGLEIGEYAMIGAGALITKDVPTRALMAGFPAKIIGWVNDDGSKMVFHNGLYIDSNNKKWIEKSNGLVAYE